MTVEDFYNNAVKVYQETGQGLLYKLLYAYKHVAEELIDMGLLKVIHDKYNYLPDDEWLCLTGVICPEEQMKDKNMMPLFFMREYLNCNDSGTGNRIKTDLEFQSDYKQWVIDNKEDLDKIPFLPKFSELNIKVKTNEERLIDYSDVIEKYKTSNHYIKNKNVSWIINNCDKQLNVYKKLIPLLDDGEHINDLKETTNDRDTIVSLKELLKRYDSNTPIQDCF